MQKIMLLGDTHGNTRFVNNVAIPAASDENVEWIYQVGDFGYWEHTQEGVEFLDDVNMQLLRYDLRLLFIQGNHDKVSLIPQRYSLSEDGFYQVRSRIAYVPNGKVWSPDGGQTNLIALGGAYSSDKPWRLQSEKAHGAQNLWFPEEEMTDSEMTTLVESVDVRIHVMLTHDKPSGSTPNIRLRPIPETLPNQTRIQQAVNTLQPRLLIHGHLHDRYTDVIRCGDNDAATQVEGLGADVSDNPQDAWIFLGVDL